MKLKIFGLCLFMGVTQLPGLSAGTVAVGIDLIIRDSSHTLRAAGSVTYTNIFGTPTSENVDIVSYISNTSARWQGSAATPFNFSFASSEPATPPNCYQAFITAVADDSTANGQSSQICEQGPPPPSGGGDGGSVVIDPGGGTYAEDPPCFYGDPTCPYSPIVVKFVAGNYVLTGRNSPVLFDMGGDGHPVLIGWTGAGADEAFLWLDRNHNGRVTSGAELFGNFTPLKSGLLAKNGFEALAEFDSNHDGVIDDRDPVWSSLQLWTDVNHNGISEAGEVSFLKDSDVVAIDLNYHWTGKHDKWGNGFRYGSTVSLRNPNGEGARKQPVYDIFFASVSK